MRPIHLIYFKHDIAVENIYIFYDRKRSIFIDLCVHIAIVSFSQVLCFLSFMSFASISLHEQNNSIRFRHFVFMPETSSVQIDYNNQSKRILAVKRDFWQSFWQNLDIELCNLSFKAVFQCTLQPGFFREFFFISDFENTLDINVIDQKEETNFRDPNIPRSRPDEKFVCSFPSQTSIFKFQIIFEIWDKFFFQINLDLLHWLKLCWMLTATFINLFSTMGFHI